MTTRGSFVMIGPGSFRDEGIVGEEGPGEVDVTAERLLLDALDEDDDLLDRREIEDEGVDDGVDGRELRRGAVSGALGDLAAEIDRSQAVLGDEDLAHLGRGRGGGGEGI